MTRRFDAMPEDGLTVVIPTYNEAARIAGTIDQLVRGLSDYRPLELLVIDDGSQDQTVATVNELVAAQPALALIASASNRGKGAAVRQGMLHAHGRYMVFVDADLPVTVSDIRRLVQRVDEGADVAIASRALREATVTVAAPPRRIASRAFNLAVRALFGLRFGDTQCGVKAFRREAAQAIFSRMQIDGFAFDVEALVIAQRLGLSVAELPVTCANAGLSTVRIARHASSVLSDLWRIRANRGRGRYEKTITISPAPAAAPTRSRVRSVPQTP